jgi:hypothetical protein
VDVSGNENMYRSQINEKEGFLIRSLSVSAVETPDKAGLFDRLTFDATDLGAGPAGGFRLDLGRSGLYRLRATYSRTELFSALPGFANPFLDSRVVPGQHTYDRTRDRFDADIEIFPGGLITPIVGYSRNTYSGPGSTTYALGQDEFRLTQDLSTQDEEARIGASFLAGPVSGQVVQGWRKFRSEETLALAPGAGNGNNVGPILGVPVTATGYTRTTNTEVDTPTTSAFVTARFTESLRFVGSFAHAKGDSDTREGENASGDFVSFQFSKFFHGINETVSSNANATQWTGFGRVEFTLSDGIDAEASYTRRHRELDGAALVSSLFLSTTEFSGVSTGDLAQLLQANTSLERTEEEFGASIAARALGPVSIRAGYYRTKEDVSISPDPSEILVPGGQGGDFSRHMDTFNFAITYGGLPSGPLGGLTLGAEYRGDRASEAVVRTDFRDRDRLRFRLAWAWKELVRVSATVDQTDVANDDVAIALHRQIRTYGGEIEATPIKMLHFRFSAFQYDADNSTHIRQPEDFAIVTAKHREDGTSYEASVGLTLKHLELSAAYGYFGNDGTFPFKAERLHFRAEIPIGDHFAGIGEWARDDYKERSVTAPNLGNYTADRYGVFVRWHL